MAKSLKEVWASRKAILEGVKNSLFTKEHIEKIALERTKICLACPLIDLAGSKCFAPGTQPCCGECGCSLKFKLRVLSEECPHPDGPKWEAILTPEEEAKLQDEREH